MFRPPYLSMILLGALALASCDDGDDRRFDYTNERVTGWEIGPNWDGQNFSKNCPASFETSFDIGPCEPHYVTRSTGPLTGKQRVTLSFRIDGDPLYGASLECNKGPASLDLFFSAAVPGEEWETGRWWASFATLSNLGPGQYTVTAAFDARWTAVMKSNAINQADAFNRALAKADRIGFTFGDCTGRGHGIGSHGKTTFTLLDFRVD